MTHNYMLHYIVIIYHVYGIVKNSLILYNFIAAMVKDVQKETHMIVMMWIIAIKWYFVCQDN